MARPDENQVRAEGFNMPIGRGAYLRWPVPLRPWFPEGADATEMLDWHWRFFQFVFPLADPREFPTLTDATRTEDESQLLRRYVSHARNLAETSVLSTKSGYTVSMETLGSEPEIEQKDVVANDATVGFLTMFRQCYSPQEEASFKRAYDLIGREAHRAGIDPQTLRAWKGAHAGMRRDHLDYLILKRASELGLVPPGVADHSKFGPQRHLDSPEQVLSTIFYGGAIHWGRHRTVVDSWDAGNELIAVQRRFDAVRTAVQLGHFYVGFAATVGRATGEIGRDEI